MKIIHLANWNSTNIGNGALIYGTQRLLQEDSAEKIEFLPEAWDNYTFGLKKFDRNFVDLINNKSDALLVNGAVTMNAFRKFNTETGMRFDLPLPLWEEIKKPIIFYGISYRCWPFQEYINAPQLKKTFEYIIKQPNIFFGVRNDGTKQWISKILGIESDKIIEVPDPGSFVSSDDSDYPELDKTKKNIIIAFNGEDPLYRFAPTFQKKLWRPMAVFLGEKNTEKVFTLLGLYKKERSKILQQIAYAVEETVSRHDNVSFILTPHYLDDYGMIDEFVKIIDERIAHQLTVSTGLLKVDHTSFFYGRYKKADLVISMRVHSMSPSIGLNIPVIPLVSQGRMRVYLKNIGLSHISVDIKKPAFGVYLAQRIHYLLSEKNINNFKYDTKKAMEKVREEVREINKIVFSLITKK